MRYYFDDFIANVWKLVLTRRSSGQLSAAAYLGSLVCAKPALFKSMVNSPAFTLSSIYPLGVLPCAGLRLLVLRQFQTFLQALRCLRGAVLFRSLRPSSSWGFPCWLLGLTGQSSRPAFGGRLIWAVSTTETHLYFAHAS